MSFFVLLRAPEGLSGLSSRLARVSTAPSLSGKTLPAELRRRPLPLVSLSVYRPYSFNPYPMLIVYL